MNTIQIKLIKYQQFLTLILFVVFISCTDQSDCDYTTIECTPECNLLEDFEDDELGSNGNWQGILINKIFVDEYGGSQALYIEDGSGASWGYNTQDFPENLLEAGCELHYDVAYIAGLNSVTTNNSIFIFQGVSPSSYTSGASFVLNTASLINSGGELHNIVVPLELASGAALPSNSYGEWVLSGITTPYSTTDIANFNTLIQNNNGIGFFVDEGNYPVEQWWYDNFCFQKCCLPADAL